MTDGSICRPAGFFETTAARSPRLTKRLSLGPDTPWHVTRFMPQFRLTHLSATPLETLENAREIGQREGLRFVYLGNVPGHPALNTYCPSCGALVLERSGCLIVSRNLHGDRCGGCGASIAGRFEIA